jgi:hypothetical protein
MSCTTCAEVAGAAIAPAVPAAMATVAKCPDCGQFVGAKEHICPKQQQKVAPSPIPGEMILAGDGQGKVKGFAYDEPQDALYIVTSTGDVYCYEGVGPEHFEALLTAADGSEVYDGAGGFVDVGGYVEKVLEKDYPDGYGIQPALVGKETGLGITYVNAETEEVIAPLPVLSASPPAGVQDGGDGAGAQQGDGAAAAAPLSVRDKALQLIAPAGGGEPVTPIGPEFEAGALALGRNGVYLALGGDDVEDQAATFYAYPHPAGGEPRCVLTCKVRADRPFAPGESSAEKKLLDALAVAKGVQYVEVAEDVEKYGQLPYDQQHNVYDNLVLAVKSLKTHLKEGGDGVVQAHVHDELAGVGQALEAAKSDPALAEMAAHYEPLLQALEQSAQSKEFPDVQVEPYQGAYTETVTKMVPLPPEPDAGVAGFPVVKRDETLPDVASGKDGRPAWDGVSRRKYPGQVEYEIDLGEGWKAVYHPHSAAEGAKAVFSNQGLLEVHPPPGHPAPAAGAVAQLQKLNLHGYLSSPGDEEYVYLQRACWAMNLRSAPGYAQAHDEKILAERQEMCVAELLEQIPPGELAGLSPSQVEVLGRDLLLRAQHRAKLARIPALRAVVAQALGRSVEEMMASPHYLAHSAGSAFVGGGEVRPGGFRCYSRPDAGEAMALQGKRAIVHGLTGNGWQNLLDCIRGGGVLLCTSRRRQAGIHAGDTMSADADMRSGGGGYFFCRLRQQANPHEDIVWEPAQLLGRGDWFGYNSDHYGAVNPQDAHWGGGSLTTDVDVAAGFTGSSNELCFKNGVSLFDYPPRAINTPGKAMRDKVLAAFHERGITHLGGRSVEEIVK